ncbi:MAG: hypothetical protein IPH33_12565 [Bacteroidetes bacterium]|nr:hypothetical protein [Bacteroidota bacterium]
MQMEPDVLFIDGDATKDDVLLEAGLEMQALITALLDAQNVLSY